MKPRMTENEIELFKKYLKNVSKYVEWGAGGSTVIACNMVKKCVISVEPSDDWVSDVSKYVTTTKLFPIFYVPIIGEIGAWSTPIDESDRHLWHKYHHSIWVERLEAHKADFFFIDGRFRVACIAQIALHGKNKPIICLHDYKRNAYSDIYKLAHFIEEIDELGIFQIRDKISKNAIEILAEHWEDPR